MKHKRKPMTAFGAIFDRDDPHVSPWTIQGTAGRVRREVGRQWNELDHKYGWRSARKDGARVVKIEIKIVSA